MQPDPPQIPSGTPIGVWYGLAVTVILAIGGWIKVWLDRKKPASEIEESGARVEEAKARSMLTRVEARREDMGVNAKFGEIIIDLSTALTAAQNAIYAQSRRHADSERRHEEQMQFMRTQIEHRQQQEERTRDEKHDALGELNRAVLTIRRYEMMMAGKLEFVPFVPGPKKKVLLTDSGEHKLLTEGSGDG